jgi:hypothetical protein
MSQANRIAMLIVIVMFGSRSGVMAQDGPSGSLDSSGACRRQILELCPGMQPTNPRLAACLKENESRLSPDCRQKIQRRIGAGRNRSRRGNRSQASGACRQEISTLCPGLKPGDQRFGACVQENRKKLSQDCQQRLQQRLSQRQSRRQRTNPPDGAGEQAADGGTSGKD